MERLRALGYDPATGKTAFCLPSPGGPLEALADLATIEAATALHALCSAILEGDRATHAELAAFVPGLVLMLGDVIDVAARGMDG